MAVELGTAYLSIAASTQGMERDIRKSLGGTVKDLDGAGKRGGARFGKGLATGLKVVGGAVAGVTALVGGMAVKGGISRALDTEDAIIQMRRMGLETKQVDALIAGVDKTFDGTIFTNPQGFKLAGLLHGANIELDKIPDVIGTIADFAAHSNVPLEQMSDIFLKVIGGGRVTGQTFNQLVAAGVPLAQIADALGMTEEEMRKTASAGQLSADMFLDAAANAEMFQGAAQAAGDGTRGAFSNVMSQLRVLGQKLVEPVFGEGGPMVTFLKSTRELLIEIRPAFTRAGEALGERLVPWIERASEGLRNLPGRLTALAAGLGGIKAILRDGQFMGSEATFGLEEDSPLVVGLLMVRDTFQQIWDLGAGLFEELEPTVRELLPALTEFWSALSPLSMLLQVIEPVLPQIAEAMSSLGQAVGGALTEAMPHLATATETLAVALVDVVNALMPLLPALLDLLPVLTPLIPPFAELVSTILPPLAELLIAIVDPIVALLVPALGLLADYLTNIGVPALEKWWGVLGAVVGGVVTAVSTYIGWLTRFWEGTVEKFNFVREHIGEFPGAVRKIFENAGEWLWQAGRDLLDGLRRGVESVYESTKERIGELGRGITDGVKNIFGIRSPSTVFAGIGRDLMRGLAKGVTDSRKEAVNALKAAQQIIVKGRQDAIKKEADRLIKARQKENARLRKANEKTLPVLSRAAAEKQAKKNLSTEIAASRAARKLVRAQQRRTGASTADLLAGLTRGGNQRRGVRGQAIEGFTLADIGRARQQVGKALAAAREVLADMRQERAALRDQVASSIRGELDLTSAIGQSTTDQYGRTSGGVTTFAGVAGVVKAMAAKAKKFAGLLGQLAKAGIPAGLIQEIAGYGTEQGTEVAKALLSGSATQIKELAADFTALENWSQKAGEYVAAATYDTAISAQEGLIKGLEADDAKLEKAAKKLAKKLAKAVKKALKIKSPSRLFRDEIGSMLPAGIIEGIDDGQRALDARVAGMVPTPNVPTPRGMAGNNGRTLSDADIEALADAFARRPIEARAYLDDREARKVTQKGIQEIRRTDPAVLR